MQNIYHKHIDSNSSWQSYWWDEDYYLCDSEEEYQAELKKYTERAKVRYADYKKRGCEQYAPTLSKEGKVSAEEYYYGHEWRGKNFTAYGFSYCVRDSRSSQTTYILKPDSMSKPTYADNRHCAGVYYGS